MAKKHKDQIDFENQRYGLFISEDSFNQDIEYGRHYLENDVEFIIKYHRINPIESEYDELYGEAEPEDKKFFPPIKLVGMVTIDEGEQLFHAGTGIIREDVEHINFNVYTKELEEKKIEITRGDILEYNASGNQRRFYEIDYSHQIADATTFSYAGLRPYWKKITAVPVKEDIVPFLNED